MNYNIKYADMNDYNDFIPILEKSRKEIDPGLDWRDDEIEEALYGSDESMIAVAEYDGDLIGFGAAKMNGKIYEDRLYFAFNYVLPEYRGKGVANGLTECIIDYGENMGVEEIVAELFSIAGKKHIQKMGFELVKSSEYFEEEPDEIIEKENGINTYVYYIAEMSLHVPDYLAVMRL